MGYTSNNFGILIAEGTSTDSIYFTSAAPAGSKTAGDWEYLGFYSGAGSNSIMKYCAVDYGGGYSDNGSIYIDGSSVKIDNSRISNSLTSDIYCHNSGRFGSFTNNNVVISQTYPVIIDANEAHTLGTGNTYSDPGIFVNAATISANVTWLAQSAPYIINGDVYVESASGNTLTISAGTVVKFDQGSDIYVGYSSNTSGKLIALGTSTNGITFTTAASPGSESAGGWNGIFFEAGTASGSILDYCTISYGGGYGAPTSGNVTCDGVGAGRLTISNSTITNSAGFGIYIPSGSTPTLTTNIFTGNVGTDTGS